MDYYFACGSRPAAADLAIARACGQRHLLIPAGSSLIKQLRDDPWWTIAIDSGAYPPNNPDRISHECYLDSLRDWQGPDGDHDWRNLAWAAAYDTIGNPAATAAAYNAAMAWMADTQVEGLPLVPVLQPNYPESAAERGDVGCMAHRGVIAAQEILDDLDHSHAGMRWDSVDGDGTLARPVYALGGLVRAFSPTMPAAYLHGADAWYTALLATLNAAIMSDDAACDDEDADCFLDNAGRRYAPQLIQIHLFGIARPSLARRAPCIASVDSATPAIMAKYGWPKIKAVFTDRYGISAATLQQSRTARLAWWLMRTRDLLGLPFTEPNENYPIDRTPAPRPIQHDLWTLLADMPDASEGD